MERDFIIGSRPRRYVGDPPVSRLSLYPLSRTTRCTMPRGMKFVVRSSTPSSVSLHPDHGITFRMPVYVQRKAKGDAAPWVSIKG